MKASVGVEIVKRLNDGSLKQTAPPDHLYRVRRYITEACEELISIGARIRPLLVNGEQVGWIRGVHESEKKALKRWIRNPNDFIFHTLALGTSLSADEINHLSQLEATNIVGVLKQMGDYDASLYPYLSAFTSTQVSENLWYSKGSSLASFEEKIVAMPDGKVMKIKTPPDHARLWVAFCNYREQTKIRLDATFNALIMVRPLAGKSADPMQAEFRAATKALEVGSLEPWQRIVQVNKVVDVNDGWGHVGDSEQELIREMNGMLSGDKHEQLMDEWRRQIGERLDREKEEIRKKKSSFTERDLGVVKEKFQVLSEAEMKERQRNLKIGKYPGAVRRQPEATRNLAEEKFYKQS
jgi:hypothetical protein